jgi:1-acyl-sn-glycerol-3-phosphate acyltransferase
MQSYKRHVRFYRGARAVLSPILKWLFCFKAQPAPDITGPYIVIANHTTDLDALLVSTSFKKHMYFVASEHLFRSRVLGGFLKYFLDPIPKQKGGADVSTAMQMVRRLKRDINIGLFAEGSKSFHGKPCPVVPATGSLVKASKASLVTYRLEGGYFTSPRWAHTFRRGRMRGYTVRVYPPEELNLMTPEEVNEAITADIGEDAYLRQAESPVAYHGRHLAKGLENALYMCPNCLKTGTLHGEGNLFTCTCGLKTQLDEMGYLSGGPFHTVDEWGLWQKEKLRERIYNRDAAELFRDEGQEIVRILPGHKTAPVQFGTLSVSRVGLCCGDFHLRWSEVLGVEVFGKNSVVFSDNQGNHYQLRSKKERSGLKYLDAYRIMAQVQEGSE